MLQHGDTAKKTGAKIVPLCGHDCIPWDLSVFKLNQLLHEKFQDEVKVVNVWDEVESGAPGGTLQIIMLLLLGNSLRKAYKCCKMSRRSLLSRGFISLSPHLSPTFKKYMFLLSVPASKIVPLTLSAAARWNEEHP